MESLPGQRALALPTPECTSARLSDHLRKETPCCSGHPAYGPRSDPGNASPRQVNTARLRGAGTGTRTGWWKKAALICQLRPVPTGLNDFFSWQSCVPSTGSVMAQCGLGERNSHRRDHTLGEETRRHTPSPRQGAQMDSEEGTGRAELALLHSHPVLPHTDHVSVLSAPLWSPKAVFCGLRHPAYLPPNFCLSLTKEGF